MPTQAYGVYPAELTAGTEVSSTYEGRHITIKENELVHPTRGSGLVVKGDPVVFGTVALQGVGVAFKSAAAATDLIAVDTEGIWNLSVVAQNDAGNVIIRGGAPLYINTTTCVISAIKDPATQVPFGYALGQVATGATAVIAVKVHWDPKCNWLLEDDKLYFGDDREVQFSYDGNSMQTDQIKFGNSTTDRIEFGTAADIIQFFTQCNAVSGISTGLDFEHALGGGENTATQFTGIRGVLRVRDDTTYTGGGYNDACAGYILMEGTLNGTGRFYGVRGVVLPGGTWTAVNEVAAGCFEYNLTQEVTSGNTAIIMLKNNTSPARAVAHGIYVYNGQEVTSMLTLSHATAPYEANTAHATSATDKVGAIAVNVAGDVRYIYVFSHAGQ